ncbi:hypothetical protein NPIL_364201 [Nephila pilipes]|uniref:Gag-like protein n=1 Tax=Nephila pilipes TaxID=299642 RepID=A0A8X6TE52_NEPPI|nr:hypothetical protein NPIL_364201 [Nephila pilipes]
MDPDLMESGESVSIQPMSLEELKIAVDTIDCTETAWAMLGQVDKSLAALPSYDYSSEDLKGKIRDQVLGLHKSARYQVQYFARKDCEDKLNELNELRQNWDPEAQMPLENDGFQVVRRKQRSPRKNSGDNTNKKQKKVLMETSNQFDNLTIGEQPDFLVEPENTPIAATCAAVRPNTASTTTNRQATRKERPVPPITIDHIPRKDLLIKQLRDLTSGRIIARMQGTGIKVFPQTTQAYQQVREFIDKFKLQSLTYQLPEHKELRVVIRGLPETTPPGNIIQELKIRNIIANSYQVIINRRTKLRCLSFSSHLKKPRKTKQFITLGNLVTLKLELKAKENV